MACTVSAETQAKMDEFASTIPTCNSIQDCRIKWNLARTWVESNSDFGIRSASEDRITATINQTTNSAMAVVVTRVALSNGGFQIVLEMDCLSSSYGCPTLWDDKVAFNRFVNGGN